MSPGLLPPLVAVVLLAVPLAALCEALVLGLWLRRAYDWRALGASLGDALLRRLVDGLGLSLATPVLAWAVSNRLSSLDLALAWQWGLLFLGQDLLYYAYHRAAHRVRWFWATHCVHHSPNALNLGAALRLGATGKLTGTALFFSPLLWLGFAPEAVAAAVALNLAWQFWLHAEWMPRLGPLEWVLNTPSHHRVHHGSQDAYLDCNYGGVLIVWDRLFGSFVAERPDLPPRYGLVEPLHSHNPLRIACHGWWALARDLSLVHSPRQALRTLFGPPPKRAAVPPQGRA